MTGTMTDEYRKLALDSSNEMMAYDSRRVLGRYPEAALHIRNAGLGRIRMGQIMFDAGEFAQAAADWLSASACFYLVPDLARMQEALGRAQKLDQEGKIPPERRDIHEALKEREEQTCELDKKIKELWLDYTRMVGSTHVAVPEALSFLRKQVRELPGYPLLYIHVADQAAKLGQQSLAVESLEWAQRFDPESHDLAVLRVSQLFGFGESVQAAQVARDALVTHPDSGTLRFLLAQALAFRAGSSFADWKAADWEAALDELRPLIDMPSNTIEKLMAISLAATLRHGLGHEAEYRRLLSAFDKLAETMQSPTTTELVTRLRQTQPHVFPQPGSNGAATSVVERCHTPKTPDHVTLRSVFEQIGSLAEAVAQ